ncbi:adenylate cyclase [Rhodobium orientis]|uniref:Adenylate cyclase n=1 Tax=Rhodobium orientis TaxID=34017 RepID=A0A327JGV1_9HYPH|nr:adenylate/guanylate cyclase domain-containing protein [Rhodobium orientis]MBB4305085.1 adenylate cyclase [Rhodobium orientis]MBK5952153.1 adenylate cyclase [Rhodobium orientis]RAI25630.1 adenylate cyclase [Rhodobium orientis]
MVRFRKAFRELSEDIREGTVSAEGMPERVAEDIGRREAQAERLIGWAQLSAVVFFSMLYAIAPRAEGATGFNFVPFALAGYFVFTVLRLWLSYRFMLPAWFLFLSIVVDVALLMALIFSFHIQYMQHPSFYLKAPTILYVFLFVSLRALRFDPRFVLTAGSVAAIGWVCLVAYAVFTDMGEMKITRNYVEYLTSNAILIGAEMDKIIAILGVTGILGVALLRARGLLFSAVRGSAAARDLSRYFAPEVARSITDADRELMIGEGVLREAAVLVVDIRTFTPTSARLQPNAVMRVLARYQAVVVPAIEAHGGRVDKFLGDGVLATFGAVEPSKTHAAGALAAAIAVLAAVDAEAGAFAAEGWPGPFRIGCAVTAGSVTVGIVGVHDRREHTVIGDPVNLAAKLETANKTEGTRGLTTTAVLDLARAQGFSDAAFGTVGGEVRKGRQVPGVTDPLDLVVIAPEAMAPVASDPAAPEPVRSRLST